MTKCIIGKDPSGNINNIVVHGHSGAGDAGEDIVCAAISVTTISVLNSLESICNEKIEIVTNEDEALIFSDLSKLKNRAQSNVLLRYFEETMLSIEDEYPEYLNVEIEEA